jgi:tetratricopeptide (TPR) repeat protein
VNNLIRKLLYSLLLLVFVGSETKNEAQSPEPISLQIKSETGTIIWVDNLRYGTISDSGEITINNLKPGTHSLRARLLGKRELTQPVIVKANITNQVQLNFKTAATPTELGFQAAEMLREKGKHKDAVVEYRKALSLSKIPLMRARIGLARSLAATSEYEDAVTEARRAARESSATPIIAAEALTVVANTFRSQGLYDDAFTNYEKALKLARNFSPEAHTGIALNFMEENDAPSAIKHLSLGAQQSNDTEPIIYYLLANQLDRSGQIQAAITAYEKFLVLEPNGKNSNTARSLLKQLKREAR